MKYIHNFLHVNLSTLTHAAMQYIKNKYIYLVWKLARCNVDSKKDLGCLSFYSCVTLTLNTCQGRCAGNHWQGTTWTTRPTLKNKHNLIRYKQIVSIFFLHIKGAGYCRGYFYTVLISLKWRILYWDIALYTYFKAKIYGFFHHLMIA